MAKPTVCHFLKTIETTAELNNIKTPGSQQKTVNMDDRRIISLLKKNPFATSTEAKTLENIGASLSKLIKGCHRECKSRGFTTRYEPLVRTEKTDQTLTENI